jgi:hypothetical protein
MERSEEVNRLIDELKALRCAVLTLSTLWAAVQPGLNIIDASQQVAMVYRRFQQEG